MTTFPALVNSLSSLPTPDEEGARGDLLRPDPSVVGSLFLSTSRLALFPSIPTTRGAREHLTNTNKNTF